MKFWIPLHRIKSINHQNPKGFFFHGAFSHVHGDGEQVLGVDSWVAITFRSDGNKEGIVTLVS